MQYDSLLATIKTQRGDLTNRKVSPKNIGNLMFYCLDGNPRITSFKSL